MRDFLDPSTPRSLIKLSLRSLCLGEGRSLRSQGPGGEDGTRRHTGAHTRQAGEEWCEWTSFLVLSALQKERNRVWGDLAGGGERGARRPGRRGQGEKMREPEKGRGRDGEAAGRGGTRGRAEGTKSEHAASGAEAGRPPGLSDFLSAAADERAAFQLRARRPAFLATARAASWRRRGLRKGYICTKCRGARGREGLWTGSAARGAVARARGRAGPGERKGCGARRCLGDGNIPPGARQKKRLHDRSPHGSSEGSLLPPSATGQPGRGAPLVRAPQPVRRSPCAPVPVSQPARPSPCAPPPAALILGPHPACALWGLASLSQFPFYASEGR